MPNTDAEDTKKLQIFIEVVDKPDIHVGVYSSPPGLKDGTDHITVSLNKANAATAKALEDGDHDEVMRLVNWMLIHEMGRWPWHYPLGKIREHVWREAGKTDEEMEKMPGFFDIGFEPSPLLKRIADLPIFGDKAELAQFDGAYKIAEIDIPESVPGLGHPAHRGSALGQGKKA
jgi:hypothetical protein